MNPVEEALQAFEKEAGMLGDFGKEMGKSLLQGTAIAAGTSALAGVGIAASNLVNSVRKKSRMRSMMSLNPDLAEYQKSNPKFFNAAYTSLNSMNPTFGKDPVVSGTVMRRMMEAPDAAGGVLMQTVSTPKAPGSPLSASFTAGPFKYNQDL